MKTTLRLLPAFALMAILTSLATNLVVVARRGAFLEVTADTMTFPDGLECQPEPVYRHRPDGKPGREILVKFTGGKLYGEADADISVAGRPTETVHFAAEPKGAAEKTILLPSGVAVDREAQISVTVRANGRSIRGTAIVPPKRQWTVFLLPHSHVDIGYTNTQDNVEFIHRRNILESIKLAKATANYPEGARFRWDTEVAWPAERLLAHGSEEEKQALLEAVRQGIIHIGASYINDNTSVSADEEFAAYFGPTKRIEKLTGVKFDTIMQVDIPGMSWGVVPAAARHGIPYVLLFNNGSDRVGLSMELSHRPFWWVGPDGRSRVLCLQPGSYAPCAGIKGKFYWPKMMGQTDRALLPAVIKTGNPREHFIDDYLWKSLEKLENDPLYPYDLFPMSWALADNTPVDADIPDAVKSWNEEYAYPRVVIATSHDIMAAFEAKYGDKIPTRTGEFTEYWSDGLGTAARQTSMNRHAKERLIQADTLWAMLRPGQPAPRADFDEAWRNILLGSEHTWCFSAPDRQPITNDILKVKFGYFQEAHERSQALLAAAIQTVSTPNSQSFSVFNTLSWPRSGLVTLPKVSKDIKSLKDEKGNLVPVQRLFSGETIFLAKDIPALGSLSYISAQSKLLADSPLKIDSTSLDNGIVKIVVDPQTGDIISLVRESKEYADSKAPCRINSYRYLHGADTPDKAVGPTQVKITIKEHGPVLASLLVESQAEGCKSLSREIRLLAGQPQVEIINVVDKLAITAKEGVHFGYAFAIPQPRTRMDIPWGVAEIDADFFPEANRNWICFQRWLDISNDERGVTWCSLDAPTFEHGNITANILGGAANSPAWLRRLQPSATIYSWALNNHWHTNFPLSQEGLLTFRYGILLHNTAYDAAAANRFGMEQARPLLAVPGKAAVTTPLTLNHPRVVVSSLKSLPEGVLVTLRSLSDQPESAALAFPASARYTVAIPSNLLGDTLADPIPVRDSKITVQLLPHAPFSFLLKQEGRKEAGAAGITEVLPVAAPPKVTDVFVVIKSHFDLGYTDLVANVFNRYRVEMMDKALLNMEKSQLLPKEKQFVWTVPGWPLLAQMLGPEQDPARKVRIEKAVREGLLTSHALPFTSHTESLDLEDLVRGLGYASSTARKYGFPLPISGKMTDVPSHSWVLPTLLHHAGIQFLHLGVNSASQYPRVPQLFWWEGADGSRLLCAYSIEYGSGLNPPVNWPSKNYLSMIMAGDNHGPPSPEEVEKWRQHYAKTMPSVKVHFGSLDNFARAILAEKPDLPIVRGDMPDTWIHGLLSMPEATKTARNIRPLEPALDTLDTQLRAWGLSPASLAAPLATAYEQSLLYGEHTWGMNGSYGRNDVYPLDQWRKTTPPAQQAKFLKSFEDHRSYIRKAEQIVTGELQSRLNLLAANVQAEPYAVIVYNSLPWPRSGLVEFNGKRLFARDVPACGYKTIPGVQSDRSDQSGHTLSTPFFNATFDLERGGISSLVEKTTGRELADPSSPYALGQFLHERFSTEEVYSRFFRQYSRMQGGWAYNDFGKPGMPDAKQVPYRATTPAGWKTAVTRSEVADIATLTAANPKGLAQGYTLTFTFPRYESWVEVEWRVDAKIPDKHPEGGWLCFPFAVEKPRFTIGRPGAPINPATDILPGANRHLLAVATGVAITGVDSAGVALCPLDSPLVSLEKPGLWHWTLDFVPTKPAVFVNLYNNMWNTNFPLWQEGSWSERVRLWPTTQGTPAVDDLTVKSWEARTPLLAVGATGKGTILLAEKAGLNVSRKGVLVTAFGQNPDGQGTLLRVWDQTGKSGELGVTIPGKFKTATPINLRGEQTGKPIALHAGKVTFHLPAYAPASFVLSPE